MKNTTVLESYISNEEKRKKRDSVIKKVTNVTKVVAEM